MKSLKLFGFLFVAVLVSTGCSKDPKTYETAAVETFVIDNEDLYTQANKLLQADYMFVLDVSASMGFNSGNLADPNASKREEFLAGIGSFVDSLDNEKINYRFGFINGNVHAGRKNDLNGRGFYKDILVDSFLSPRTKDNLVDDLQDLGETLNENTNLMLEAADKVMSSEKANFVRPGSQLIYIFVSDTDDESTNYITGKGTSTTDYANRLIAHKGSSTNIAAFVSARAIVAGVNSGCNPQEDFGETTGRRLAETAQIIENKNRTIANLPAVTSSQVSHCILRASSSFPTLLSQLGRDVSKPTNIFQLQVANVDVNSIRVFIDGTRVLSNDANHPWTYLTSSNAIKFADGKQPASSSRVTLRYNQFFVLKGKPTNVESINVTVNGGVHPSSSTDGWSYNASMNRIEFNGTTLPNGTRIEVNY